MILLDDVVKYYPGDKKPALDNISLHIQPKEFVFLVGKSGAGKSTLYQTLDSLKGMKRVNTDEIVRSFGNWKNPEDVL